MDDLRIKDLENKIYPSRDNQTKIIIHDKCIIKDIYESYTIDYELIKTYGNLRIKRITVENNELIIYV